MDRHRYTLVVIALTASLCIQKWQSDAESTETLAICETPTCLSAANIILQKMRTNSNPCEDFNEFACGRFIEETQVPDGRGNVWAPTIVEDANTAILHDIITKAVKPTDPQYLINIKRFYNSCIDEDTIEAVGLTPYLIDSEFVNDWPTLNPTWSGANFDLKEVIVRYSRVLINPFFDIDTTNDISDTNRMAIYLTDGDLLLSQKTYSQPRNSTVLQAFEKYLVEFAVALDANREVAKQDARDVVDLEIELAKIMVPLEKQNDITVYNPFRLTQLSTMYPQLGIVRFARTVFGLVNITLADTETVINAFPTYIRNISRVVQQFSNRTLQNLFGFHYAIDRVGELTQRMQQIAQDFRKVYTGAIEERPRWKFCQDIITDIFWKGISKQYVASNFSATAKHNVDNMIVKIKEVLYNMTADATWISSESKIKALAKLGAMKKKVAYPDAGFEEADIEEEYGQYIMNVDNFYANMVLGIKQATLTHLATYRKPVNKNDWRMRPFITNSDYDSFRNEIVFPAGVLQKPFYSETFPDYMNYGAIGAIIGYELALEFFDQGNILDDSDNLEESMSPEDREYFASKTQCIKDQTSNTYVEEVNMTLNGGSTLRRIMADRGALKMAFRTYRYNLGNVDQQPRLPGLNLTSDQLFFLSAAQVFCTKYTPQRLMLEVKYSPSLPGKYRILTVLQNSEEFARAYNCPRGSFMNPEHKCNVW
ncbi:hypothetical protein BsWGS_26871 [Bradybaena similaris]